MPRGGAAAAAAALAPEASFRTDSAPRPRRHVAAPAVASKEAARAAADITKTPLPNISLPWFWSEQYDVRLQSAGIVPAGKNDIRYAVRPGKREGGMSVWSYDNGRLVAVEAVHDPAAYMLGKKCLENYLSPPPLEITDPAFDLKTFATATPGLQQEGA